MQHRLRIAFMGTPDFTCAALQELIAIGQAPLCVYTQPPRPKGRGQALQKTPVHLFAEEHGIEVRTPPNFKNPDDVRAFEDLRLDVAVVAGYGMILPKTILSAPKHGCLNIHPSLLPRWRGVAPVQFAVWNGDEKTGVCVMKLDEKMDTGPIIAREETLISAEDTSESLNARLWPLGAAMLGQAIRRLAEDGDIVATPQSIEGATYTRFLTKEDGRIDWTKNVVEIDRQVRALNQWPGTWCLDTAGSRMKILAARPVAEQTGAAPGTVIAGKSTIACADGMLEIRMLQPEGKKPMTVTDALRGKMIADGQVLS